MSRDDTGAVSCERMREAISSMVDGEDPGADVRLVEAHVRRCPSCRQYREVALGIRPRMRVDQAPEMPDLSHRAAKLAAMADRASSWSIVRAVLAVVAVEIIALSIPDLLARDARGEPAHDARHLGAFTVAYGVALLVVVIRPVRARTILPVAMVLAGALLITAAVDLANGNVPFANEVRHLPELLSVGLVWLLASPARRRPQPARRAIPPELRLVEQPERGVG